jgi:hypothetical protein
VTTSAGGAHHLEPVRGLSRVCRARVLAVQKKLVKFLSASRGHWICFEFSGSWYLNKLVVLATISPCSQRAMNRRRKLPTYSGAHGLQH